MINKELLGGGDAKDEQFTFHFTTEHYTKVYGFGIAGSEVPYENVQTFLLDEFQPSESSFVKTYSKVELLDALSKAALLRNSTVGLVARLGGMGYRANIFVGTPNTPYPNYLFCDAIFFRNYGQISQMIVGYITNDAETYNNLASIIENYDECWLEISWDYD